MLAAGTTIAELEADLAQCREYNTKPIVRAEAMFQLKLLGEAKSGSKPLSNMSYQLFSKFCIEDGWTQAHLDYAIKAWHWKDTAFMPDFGQLRAILERAKSDPKGPGPHRVVNYERAIKAATMPKAIISSPSNEAEKINTEPVVAKTIKKTEPPRRKIYHPRTVEQQLAELKADK